MRAARGAAALATAVAAGLAAAAEPPPGLQACSLRGVEHGAWCGVVQRPLDPARPDGPRIDVRFAVLPALARQTKPDPVFFIAGGPGQSAVALAGRAGALLARLSNRRDIVLVDQRGTGQSAPLDCDDDAGDATRPLADAADPARQAARLAACRERLQGLPHGDLRRYTTPIAMQDLDAVRRALGAARVNLVGGSYGTRAALDYARQFPQAVRRLVLDGVAPPDMALPAAGSADAQAALDAMFAACDAEAACRARHPALRERWQALLASLPREVALPHPFTGEPQAIALTRETLLALVRAPLYAPALAAALPEAIERAAAGRFEALAGLASGLGGGRAGAVAQGMHFSVVCAEDVPLLAAAADRPGADFGDSLAASYRRICADWPRGELPADFRRLPPAPAPALLLSGGLDPATPPRHGERVARALGAKARHLVVANAGHGTLALPCVRDLVFRFVDADDEAVALAAADAARCALPRPPAFVPPRAASEPAR